MLSDIGLIGLAVMGENLVLNIENKGFSASVFNRSTEKIDKFLNGRGLDKKFYGAKDIGDFCRSLATPRKIIIMVKSGNPVDRVIDQLLPHLDAGDIIIDGGNSHYKDSSKRYENLKREGIYFVGAGISGGEEGALNGPSIMPGGSAEAWSEIQPIFNKIAAKTSSGEVCCNWVGSSGSGHFVKMVHNGIEYGDMQMICEAYHIMRFGLNLSNDEIADVFDEWNKSELNSYLIEITKEILRYENEDGERVVDFILDSSGQKGTGKWTAKAALDYGQPLSLIAEAVFARCLSSFKEERVEAAKSFTHSEYVFNGDKKLFVDNLKQALYASKIISYTQGFQLLKAASNEYKWDLNLGDIALVWRGGCIIRSVFLNQIKNAYDNDNHLSNLLMDPFFNKVINKSQDSWRAVMKEAISFGIPTPAMSSALAYFDGYKSERLPSNLLQAQRDYFGAHTYERVDKDRGLFFHTNWTGKGGQTSSSSYQV